MVNPVNLNDYKKKLKTSYTHDWVYGCESEGQTSL